MNSWIQPTLKFSDLFREESMPLGIRRRHVEEALRRPDHTQIITFEDASILLLTRRITVTSCEHLLWIQATPEGKILRIDLALKMWPDIGKQIFEIPPLDALEVFLKYFGLDIQIGDKVAKLFVQESIPIQGSATRIVKIAQAPADGIVQTYLKLHDIGGYTLANVALAFAIDKSAYLAWARQHGVSLL